jgi:O-antigen/teichoic acid export membrane protein
VARVAPVGGGLFLLGLSAYVVLGTAGHALAPRDYAAVASLYLLVAITSPGVFTALEQEVNRGVSSRRAAGLGTGAVARCGLLVGTGYVGVLAVVLLAAAPWLVPRVLGGHWSLLAAAIVATVGAAAVYLLRGLFAGERRFGWYAASLGLEGVARLVPCVVLALAGATDPLAFGWAFALGTGIAALACLPGRTSSRSRRWVERSPGPAGSATTLDPATSPESVPIPPTGSPLMRERTVSAPAPDGAPVPVGSTTIHADATPMLATDGALVPAVGAAMPDPPIAGKPLEVRAMARATGLLVVASGLTYVVANTAPLALTARLPAAPEVAASFVSLFVLARIPVFLFGPVQAFLLPTLTAGAERADLSHLRSRLRVALLAVAAVGIPGALLTAALGPWAARTFFGAPLDLPHAAAGLLGAGTVAMLAAQVLQPALVALRVHRMATTAWVVGVLAFGAVLVAPVDPTTAAVTAQVVGPTVVCLVMGVTVAARLRRMADAPSP